MPVWPIGGDAVESFRATEMHTGNLPNNGLDPFPANTHVPFSWNRSGSGWGQHHSSGVSGLDTTVQISGDDQTSTVASVPAGLWVASLGLRVSTFNSPVDAGTMLFYIVAGGVFSQYAQVSPQDFEVNGSVTVHITDHFWLPTDGTIKVQYVNTLTNSGADGLARIDGGYLSATRIGVTGADISASP